MSATKTKSIVAEFSHSKLRNAKPYPDAAHLPPLRSVSSAALRTYGKLAPSQTVATSAKQGHHRQTTPHRLRYRSSRAAPPDGYAVLIRSRPPAPRPKG